MKTRTPFPISLLILFLVPSACHVAAAPLDSAFTYQGRLSEGGQAAVGVYVPGDRPVEPRR